MYKPSVVPHLNLTNLLNFIIIVQDHENESSRNTLIRPNRSQINGAMAKELAMVMALDSQYIVSGLKTIGWHKGCLRLSSLCA